MIRLLLPAALAGLSPAAHAQTTAPSAEAVSAAKEGVVTTTTDANGAKVETKPYAPAALPDNETGRQKFGGIDFGIGVAFTYDLGNNERIKEATIVDNVVRVTRTENVRARLILESHYFFTPPSAALGNYSGAFCDEMKDYPDQKEDCDNRRKNFGIGPFMAIQPGTDNIIDAIGAGVMIGLRRRQENSASFNIGIGILYDVNTQILGDGFVENQAPPGKETEVRFRRGSQSGLLIMTSYSF